MTYMSARYFRPFDNFFSDNLLRRESHLMRYILLSEPAGYIMLGELTSQDMTMITVEIADPFSSESQRLIETLSAELAAITGDNGKSNFNVEAMNNVNALWVLAKNSHGEAVGCGAIRPLTQNIAELKRMFSDRSVPGIGGALLAFLETSAKERGYSELRLETRHINHRAVNFYEKHGYRRIENYGPYTGRPEAACFSKVLR